MILKSLTLIVAFLSFLSCFAQKDTLFIIAENVNVNSSYFFFQFNSQDSSINTYRSPKISPPQSLVLDTLSDGRLVYKGLPGSYDQEIKSGRTYLDTDYISTLNVENITFKGYLGCEMRYVIPNNFNTKTYIESCVSTYEVKNKGPFGLIFYHYYSIKNFNNQGFHSIIENEWNQERGNICFEEKEYMIYPCSPTEMKFENLELTEKEVNKKNNIVYLIPQQVQLNPNRVEFKSINPELISILQQYEVVFFCNQSKPGNFKFHQVSFQIISKEKYCIPSIESI